MNKKLFDPNHSEFCYCNVYNKTHEQGLEEQKELTKEEFEALIHEVSSYKYLGD